MKLNEYRDECYKTAQEKGFWNKERNNAEMIALMHSELSEALEALRKNRWRGKDSVGEELADCIIRILDFAGGRNINIEKEVNNKMIFNKSRTYKHNKEF